MLVNLFSIFDPSIYFMRFGWLGVLFFLFIFFSLGFNRGRIKRYFLIFLFFVYGEVRQLLRGNKFFFQWVLSLFVLILVSNLSSLFPSLFAITSQVLVVFPLAFSFWFSFLLFGWVKFSGRMLKSLTPQGTPGVLMNFIVVIELVRNLIRPLTLSVRLVANITAGHLLISVLIGFLVNFNFTVYAGLIALLMNLLELGVAFIQSYVFVVLVSMYASEV